MGRGVSQRLEPNELKLKNPYYHDFRLNVRISHHCKWAPFINALCSAKLLGEILSSLWDGAHLLD